MTLRILLDASVLFAAASSEMATLARLSQLSIGDVAIPAVAYAELLSAAALQKNPRLAENLSIIAQNFDILPFDRRAADAFGALMRKVEPKRRRMLDRMVAAQAIAEGLALATLAPDDYADVTSLKLERWS